jgi:thiamine biosynthesis lipoprotein
MTLTAYGKEAEAALTEAEEFITNLENQISTNIDTSEISLLNKNGEGTVSEDTLALINRSLDIYKSTGGAFDITIYPIVKAWGFTTESYQVPSDKKLASLMKLIDSDSVKVDTKNKKVKFEKSGMQIDLGGIAKGYTSAAIMEIFKSHDIQSAVISLGGNVQVLGTKTTGENWRVAIQSPDDSSTYLGVLSTHDKAVVTSGGYERYFEQDGKTYHHIIDPSTGYPADTGLTSVTIVSEDGTLADGLSTSLFVMGKEKAVDYWKKHQSEFDMILVEQDGTISVTSGIASDFTAEDATVNEISGGE